MNTISIKPYSKEWPLLFEAEKNRLGQVLGDSMIEHIGSTAVPGLAAKPVIDMMASVKNLEETNSYIDSLSQLGYKYAPEIEEQTPDRKFFQNRTKSGPWYHLSLTEITSDYWIDHILFRDYLREHEEVRKEYEALKLKLAQKHIDNFDAFTLDKTEFILGIIKKAKNDASR